MNSMTSISDGTSDAHTHWSGQHSATSSTTNTRCRHPRNPKQARPALRDYQGTKTYDILVLAKEAFTATAFSEGLFFDHKRSPHHETFRNMSLDIFTHTAQQKDCRKSFDLGYHYHCAYTVIFSRHSSGQWPFCHSTSYFSILLFCLKAGVDIRRACNSPGHNQERGSIYH